MIWEENPIIFGNTHLETGVVFFPDVLFFSGGFLFFFQNGKKETSQDIGIRDSGAKGNTKLKARWDICFPFKDSAIDLSIWLGWWNKLEICTKRRQNGAQNYPWKVPFWVTLFMWNFGCLGKEKWRCIQSWSSPHMRGSICLTQEWMVERQKPGNLTKYYTYGLTQKGHFSSSISILD